MYKLSIVVPVYNVEDYIEKCISSIKNQTYQNIEVIVVDDGSKDNSIEIAKKTIGDDERFKIVRKKNGGLSDARNYGVQYVTGDFISFVDSDDFLDINLFEKAIEKANEEDLDIVLYDFIKYYSEDKQVLKKCLFDKSDIYSSMRTVSNAWNKIIRTSIWKNNELKFPVGIWYEDIAIIPALLKYTKKVGYVENAFYFYSIREGSITNQTKYNPKVMDILKSFDYLDIHLENEYPIEELEYLYVLHILYMGTQRVVEFDKKEDFYNLLNFVENKFPNWYLNKKIHMLPKLKYLYLLFIRYKKYSMCRALVLTRKKIFGEI